MANRKGKFPRIETSNEKLMRQVSVGSGKQAVIASENPVPRWDESRGIVVNEVLLMNGMELRGGHYQLPIVDSHNDKTVRNIFGSIRNLRIEGDKLVGETSFASDSESQIIAQRVEEGHITDFSITADIIESMFVARGQSYTTPSGNVIDGPAIIVTRWQPHNASICATGADEQSMVRRSYMDLNRKVKRMDEALLGQLSSMGMPEGMTDPNQILAWVVGKLSASDAPEQPEMVESAAEPMAPVAPAAEELAMEPVVEKSAEPAAPVARSVQDIQAEIKRALETDQKRRTEIQAACKLARVERAFADELCDSGVTVEEANRRIIERMATQPVGASVGADVRVTGDGQERFYNAVSDGLVRRAYRSARIKNIPQASSDAKDFEHLSLNRLAEVVLRQQGIDTSRMNAIDVAKVAMGNKEACRRHRVERAYHTTGSFTNLLLDASNKTLLAAYEEAPYTWSMWARQGSSVPDFKNINRIRFSESPDPEMVPERHEYKEKEMSDSKESYKVEKYGALFTVSWETVVNDDLDAISRIPAMHGSACRRKVNKEVYSVLTANPTMGDTYSLFSASHASGSNLSGAGASPSVTTLNTAFAAMLKQTGLSRDVIISVQPRYLIVPVALSATALQLVASIADPSAGGSAAGNSNSLNIYGPNGSRPLQVVVEANLDANSTSAWYLAADPSQIDTVEVTFLQGEESPVLEDEWDFDKDVYKFKVRQTFGVKAIDWRGLYKYAAS